MLSASITAPAAAQLATSPGTSGLPMYGENKPPQLSAGDATVTESDDQSVVARVPVTLSAPASRTVTVQYVTIDGTATAPEDYLARLATLVFAPGQTQHTVEVPIVGDHAAEQTESFGVALARAGGATVAREIGVVTILDDDAASTTPVADRTPPDVRVGRPRLKRTSKATSVLVRVSCPGAEESCRGRMTLFTRADRAARATLLRRERRLGRVSFTLSGGKARTLRVKLGKRVIGAARRSGRLRVAAYVLTDDVNGNTDRAARSATLRFRR